VRKEEEEEEESKRRICFSVIWCSIDQDWENTAWWS
jgi:hypothetical protein